MIEYVSDKTERFIHNQDPTSYNPKNMRICPQCRARFEEDMNFCLQDGTPLIEEEQFTNLTESFSEKTLSLPPNPNLPPTILPTQDFYATRNPPTAEQSIQPTVALSNQPTASAKMETSPVFASLTTDLENSRSRSNVMVASFVGILALIGTAIGGVWWVSDSKKNTDQSLANTTVQNPATAVNKNLDSGFSTATNSTTFGNQAETNFKSEANGNQRLSTPTPAETTKQTPVKETDDKPTPKTAVPEETEPPPDRNLTPKPVPKTISGGVVNSRATSLTKPEYPAAARAVRASGAVNVQVTIDENGNVISASAVSGHPLLRSSAVNAARSSKFSPTMLSGQKVKVTGVIVYNFVP